MSSKSSVGLSRSTALGVSLIGLSATLFAVDVTGTLALERERDAAGSASRSAVASTDVRPPVIPAESSVRAAALSNAAHIFAAPTAVAAVVPLIRRSTRAAKPSPLTTTGVVTRSDAAVSRSAHAVVGDGAVLLGAGVTNGGNTSVAAKTVEPHKRGDVASSVHKNAASAAHDPLTSAAHRAAITRYGVVAHTADFVARKRVNEITPQPMSIGSASTSLHGKRLLARETAEQQPATRELRIENVATSVQPQSSRDAVAAARTTLKPVTTARAVTSVTLRDVRRFVMYELKKGDRHVCVISAMTYPVADRQVIVDLVFRDDKGRWSEKAVVRRGGNAVKLIGVKRQPLPYKTIAATGFAPSR